MSKYEMTATSGPGIDERPWGQLLTVTGQIYIRLFLKTDDMSLLTARDFLFEGSLRLNWPFRYIKSINYIERHFN